MVTNELNIVFASNKFYLPHMATCIASIFINAAPTSIIKIHILHSSITLEEQNEILSLLKLSKNNLSIIEFLDLTYIAVPYEVGKYFSIEAMYRLYVVDLFPDLNKLIYLDCDTIVLTDLNKLLEEDLTHFYLAGVKDFIMMNYSREVGTLIKGHQINLFEHYNATLNFSHADFAKYVQSAVIVFNLKKIRQDNKATLMLEIQEKFPRLLLADQDIINYSFKGQIKHLSARWNFGGWSIEEAIKDQDEKKLLLTSKEHKEFKDAMKNPYIIHYVGSHKPSRHSKTFNKLYYKLYWVYRQQTPYKIKNGYLKTIFFLNFFRGYKKRLKKWIINLRKTNNLFLKCRKDKK
ncbi:Glycosyltransferase family 8 domain protein [Candidatus Hepatincolaceae symbiont of Richtersius coronifer]